MSTYFILRKANGEILTVDRNGEVHIPVWDDEIGIRRCKRSNPNLIVYVPAIADERFIKRICPHLELPFFLVDSRDDTLRAGRTLSAAELFSRSNLERAA